MSHASRLTVVKTSPLLAAGSVMTLAGHHFTHTSPGTLAASSVHNAPLQVFFPRATLTGACSQIQTPAATSNDRLGQQ
uniref:Putative secreted protein n=1 Tax=Ixodes ricinus TaxID=34613 RepID=A0A6B0U4T2_IXORI